MPAAQHELCIYCTALFPIADAAHTTRPFHTSWRQFDEQVGSCCLCQFISLKLKSDTRLEKWHNDGVLRIKSTALSVRLRYPRLCPNGVRWAILEVTLRMPHSMKRVTQEFSITTCEKDCKSCPVYFLTRPVNKNAAVSCNPIWKSLPSTPDEKTLLIKDWYGNCEVDHGAKCRPAVGNLPTRLIDVGSAPLSVKLVLGSDVSTSDRNYTTLSHCWGVQLPIRTTRSNLHLYSQAIPPESIPRTFREAFAVTQALGIQYIWIDALCIIQDSPEEWEKEVSIMKDVYSRSRLNIAAADSANSNEGCFADVKINEEHDWTQFSLYDSNNVLKLTIKVQIGDSRRITEHSILGSRGWVLQEQLLSPRMVSCMGSELHWQCAHAYRTESGVEFNHDSAVCGTPHLRNDLSISHERVWRIWMENFSQRKFTFWNDRLPALAGITEYYESTTKDAPLLGLWKTTILQDLLWIRLSDSWASVPCKETFLPSWSWLSCPARIEFDIWQISSSISHLGIGIDEHAKLLDYNVTWSRSPMTSAVTSACLVLEGPVIEVSLKVAHSYRDFNPPYFVVENTTIEPAPDTKSSIPWVAAGQFDTVHHAGTSSNECLLILSREHQRPETHREIFLIIERVSTNTMELMYRRIGIGCFFGKSLEFSVAQRKRVYLV